MAESMIVNELDSILFKDQKLSPHKRNARHIKDVEITMRNGSNKARNEFIKHTVDRCYYSGVSAEWLRALRLDGRKFNCCSCGNYPCYKSLSSRKFNRINTKTFFKSIVEETLDFFDDVESDDFA